MKRITAGVAILAIDIFIVLVAMRLLPTSISGIDVVLVVGGLSSLGGVSLLAWYYLSTWSGRSG
ncbi:hypothetical protein KOM00_07385 [Geomonas sp. Red69]|uniref:hypothetical protein n=1 Tax=Geomonas diazotrophica TaxID=2843197 RepID=UPI001C1047D4|nr:hypothetical protein [Geomonas diazotrophica]MBU5636558.1 hypothetical protein [Geomonas diazotrophica]